VDFVRAVGRAPVHEELLKLAYLHSPLAGETDTFVLYRIIGNDLPPRHRSGQSLANLRFILENEPLLSRCEKHWVVNRITDPDAEAAILKLLRDHGQPILHIPFVSEDYAKIGLDFSCLPRPDFLSTRKFARLRPKDQKRILVAVHRLKNNYVMNNNGARNAALADGRARAKWILPFDGNCFFTLSTWEKVISDVTSRPWLKYFAVPMARVMDNRQLLDPAFVQIAKEEPQLIFRRDAGESFNPAFPYGRRPKVELFWRLGIPGPWDLWTEATWDQPRRPLSPEAFQFGLAGWVARLFSGVSTLENNHLDGPAMRGIARQEAILDLLGKLDARAGRTTASPVELR